MIRGFYTGASGMIANQVRMDVIANNLANVDKTAFKKDEVVYKNFPELLLHRTNDDGVGWMPMGSFDISPLVGKLGTGVEVNEIYTRFDQGSLKKTDKATDIALNGKGFLVVQTNRGARLTRSGAFILNDQGMLVTPDGFPLLGEKGPIQVNRHNFIIKPNGEVWINGAIGNDPTEIYGKDINQWENPILLDKLQIRTVDYPRHLNKEGTSFYVTTPESGAMRPLAPNENLEVLQGFLETSNVNLVREMTSMIEVQRSYELNQKSITTHDSMLGQLLSLMR
ncbi:MAG: flagellar hook-basal body protein [Candidatus Hydrogenedentota bacterium]|nr:MAG: flagellar hook-basal body protein [Candidatus Hydrogenedentota bacterium]